MKAGSAEDGNIFGDETEVSRRHSSQMPIVMVGTRLRPEHLEKGGELVRLE